MAEWRDLSLQSRKAAQVLRDEACYRASVSRSYYCAYSAVTEMLLQRGVSLAAGRRNPAHEALVPLVRSTIGGVDEPKRKLLSAALRRLYAWRLDADYRPGITVGEHQAREALRNASTVLSALGVIEHGDART